MGDKKQNGKKKKSEIIMENIVRIQNNNNRRNEKIARLKEEVIADNLKIKELEKQYAKANQAELEEQISTVMFKDNNMSDIQVLKILEITKQIGDKIDNLDTDEVVNAIISASTESKKRTKPTPQTIEPPVETSDEIPLETLPTESVEAIETE
jgi:hypothetical protein